MSASDNSRNESTAKHYKLEDQIGFLLRRSHQFASSLFQAKMTDYSLTPPQFSALVVIDQQSKAQSAVAKTGATQTPAKTPQTVKLSQNELGRLIDTDPATMQGVIKRLDERGYITIVADPDHKRKRNFTLTAAGRKVVDDTIPIAKGISEDTLAALTEKEQLQLISLLKKMVIS